MILVTGATGFLGGYVVRNLVEGYSASRVRCFVRQTSDTCGVEPYGVGLVYGDLDDSESLAGALEGVDTFVNIASLGFGHAPNIVTACERASVRRAIFISTTAIFTTFEAGSKAVRTEAERLIRESRIDYTILRPTMIYGSERDRNICRLIRYLAKYPVIPIFGSGEYLQQPVFVQDVADAVTQSLDSENTSRKAYNIAGAKPLTYDAMIDTVCRLLKKRCLKVHLPLGLSVWAVRGSRYIPGAPRLSVEQLLRLNENKAFAIEDAVRDFGYSPIDFEAGVRTEIRDMVESQKAPLKH